MAKSNQGNQDSSGNQKNAIQGQRQDRKKKDTHNKEHKTTKIICTKQQKVNEQLGLH